MKEIQVFHFGEQMFKCPEGGGWRQKMRCEKICESGVKHVFPRGGEGPSLSAPSPTNSKHNASLHGQRAASGLGTVGGAAFAKQHLGLVPLSCPPTPVPSPPPPPISLIPLASYVQDIMGTVPSTLRMNRFPGGLSLYLRG